MSNESFPTEQRMEKYWRLSAERLLKDRVAFASGTILLLISLVAILAPWIAPYGYDEGVIDDRLMNIGSPGHVLGTDEQGRDMLTRLLFGARLTLLTGLLPVVIGVLIGGGLGVFAGFMGETVSMVIMRIMDIFYAFPGVLLAVAVVGVLGPGIMNCIIAMAIVVTPPITRVAESVTAQTRKAGYIEAARASGAGARQIMVFHILPNVLSPILVYCSTLVGICILYGAGLSFLGLGVSSPDAEWGLMLQYLRQYVGIAPLIAALPGFAIMITTLCFNLFSDGLRDALDVTI